MLKNKIKQIFLFLILSLLLIGIVNATNTTTDTSNTKIISTNNKIIDNTQPTNENINIYSENKNLTVQKESNMNEIKKQNTTKINTKTAPGTYTTTVSTYSQVASKIAEAKTKNYSKYTINLKKGNYQVTSNLNWANTKGTKTLEINANQSTLNGKNTYQFIKVNQGYTLIIKNAK